MRRSTAGVSQPFSAARSLHRLRTALSSPHSPHELSPVSEMPTSPSFSERSSRPRSSMSGRFSQLASSVSAMSIGSFRIRRSPSQIELEQEEEKRSCGEELLSLVEPRPQFGLASMDSMNNVLFGSL